MNISPHTPARLFATSLHIAKVSEPRGNAAAAAMNSGLTPFNDATALIAAAALIHLPYRVQRLRTQACQPVEQLPRTNIMGQFEGCIS